MIVYLGNGKLKTNEEYFSLNSICELKKIKQEEVILIIDKDIDTRNVINENIVIDEVFITLNIKYCIIFNNNENLINKLNNYNIKYILF